MEPTRFKARPTTYKGIQMRSRLEASFAARLDAVSARWQYEPRCFANEHGQYLPDFQLLNVSGSGFYVEVKPGSLLHGDEKTVIGNVDAVMEKMEIIWSSEPDAALEIFVAGEHKDTIFSGYRDHGAGIWVMHGRPVSTIWPGRGQLTALVDARRVR